MISGFTALQQQFIDEEAGVHLYASSIKLNLPIELQIEVDEDTGKVELGTAPPTQQIETTFMPVFHQLKLTITESDGI